MRGPALALLLAATCLAGCEARDTAAPATDAVPVPATEPAAAPATPEPTPASDATPITDEGWGPIRIGMTREELQSALPNGFKPEASGVEPNECRMLQAVTPTDLWVMLEKGVVTRVTIHRDAVLKTDKGLGLGATSQEVRAAYTPSAVTRQPHKYEDAPAEDLFVWTTPGQKGIRYEVAATGKVKGIHAGGSSITYVEACS